MGLFRKPSLSRMLGISAAKARLSRQLGFSITNAAKGVFAPTKTSQRRSSLVAPRSHSTPRRSAVVVGEPSEPDAVLVRISARDFSFPLVCPCCLGPADVSIHVDFIRPNGESKGWQVPYCKACLEYDRLVPLVDDLCEELDDIKEATKEYVESVRTRIDTTIRHLREERDRLLNWHPPTFAVGLLTVIGCGFLLSIAGLLLSLWIFAAILAVTWLATVPVVVYWSQIIDWLQRRHAAKVQANAEDLRTAETDVPAVLAQAKSETTIQVQEVATAYQQLIHNLEAVSRPDRVGFGKVVVEYLGWEGTIHTFAFAHPGFAAAFCAVNEGKKVW